MLILFRRRTVAFTLGVGVWLAGAPGAQAAPRVTLACAQQVAPKPSLCLVYTLPGPVIKGSRASFTAIRWSTWGTRKAWGRAMLLRPGRRVPVTLVAHGRLKGSQADYFYSRLTVTDRSGATQRVNLDELTEES